MKNNFRQQALQWWHSLTEIEKENFFLSYNKYTPASNHTELTGREIQNIWAVNKSQI